MKPVFELTGGRLCLDFANTVDDRPTIDPTDRLKTYSDLLVFGEQTGIFRPSEVHALRRLAMTRVREAAERFHRAIALRENIFLVFSAVAANSKPPLKDVWALNAALRTMNAHAVVLPKNGRFTWVWRDNKKTIDRLLWEITRSAIDLLTSNDMKLVKQCAADDCDWLFIDSSRSHNRRWCEMRTCGNRHKAKDYYRRRTEDRKRSSGS